MIERVPLDMDAITRSALGVRWWRLEYDCNGAPYVATIEASNESAADSIARVQLQEREPNFRSADAALTACVEAS